MKNLIDQAMQALGISIPLVPPPVETNAPHQEKTGALFIQNIKTRRAMKKRYASTIKQPKGKESKF